MRYTKWIVISDSPFAVVCWSQMPQAPKSKRTDGKKKHRVLCKQLAGPVWSGKEQLAFGTVPASRLGLEKRNYLAMWKYLVVRKRKCLPHFWEAKAEKAFSCFKNQQPLHHFTPCNRQQGDDTAELGSATGCAEAVAVAARSPSRPRRCQDEKRHKETSVCIIDDRNQDTYKWRTWKTMKTS